MGYGLSPLVFEGVSAVTLVPSESLGTRREHDGKRYCYVYNAGNSQINPGEGATVSGVSGYSVTVSSVTLADVFVGVCHHATLTTGTYGWLVTQGFAKVKAVADTGLVAGPLAPGGDGRWAPALSTMTANVQGKCTVATASGGTGEAYVKCLFE